MIYWFYRVKKKAILCEGALKSAPFVFVGAEDLNRYLMDRGPFIKNGAPVCAGLKACSTLSFVEASRERKEGKEKRQGGGEEAC